MKWYIFVVPLISSLIKSGIAQGTRVRIRDNSVRACNTDVRNLPSRELYDVKG